MHILTFTSLFPNEKQPVLAVFIRNRMLNFAKRFGHNWTIVAPIPYYPRFPFPTLKYYDLLARVPSEENLEGYKVYHPRYFVFPKIGMRWYGKWMKMGVKETVLKIHREHPIDLIDGHYIFPDATAAIEIGRELGIPVVLSARGTDLNFYPGFSTIRKLIVKNLEYCDHLICVCSELKEVATGLGMPSQKISVIGNGVDTTSFGPGDQNQAREKIGIKGNKKIFISVGQMIKRKGFHILIEAFSKLGNKDTKLVLIGEGPELESFRQLSNSLGLGERVLFPGPIKNNELSIWYQAADFFALATLREGWPNVICEAQACGLPVIATEVSGIPEIINAPEFGILIKERNVEAFKISMEYALEKKWDKKIISGKGMSRTWDSVSDEINPIFTDLVLKHISKNNSKNSPHNIPKNFPK